MSPAEIKLVRLVTARVAKMTPPVARAYLRAINILRDSLGAEELARRIARGVFDVFDDATLNAAFNGYRQELRAAVAEGFRYTAPDINQVPLTFKQPAIFFDVLSPRVRLAITQLEDRIITTAKAEVRETVRQAVAAGLEGGTNPRTVARGLRDVIGLAPKDEKAIRAFRAELQRGDRDALNRALGRGTITLPDGRTTTRAAHAGGYAGRPDDHAGRACRWVWRERTRPGHAQTDPGQAAADVGADRQGRGPVHEAAAGTACGDDQPDDQLASVQGRTSGELSGGH